MRPVCAPPPQLKIMLDQSVDAHLRHRALASLRNSQAREVAVAVGAVEQCVKALPNDRIVKLDISNTLMSEDTRTSCFSLEVRTC